MPAFIRYSLIKQESTQEDREPPSLEVGAYTIAMKATVDKTPGKSINDCCFIPFQ